MAAILRKPVPPPRTPCYAQAYSYAAAPSISDDGQMIAHTTPSSYNDSLEPTAARDSSDKSMLPQKVKEYKAIKPEETSPWGIHWYSPALMLGLFSVGIATSIAHHIFYDSLDGKDVGTTVAQEWAIRIGTGMAFIIKASLAAAVGVAYTQRLWVTLKKKAITLQAVDDLFLLTVTPTSFFSWEVVRKAKLLCLMAASMWFIPLVATITPATLSISPTFAHTMRDIVVPSLDFAGESSKLYYVVNLDTSNFQTPGVVPSSSIIGPSVFVKQLLSAVSMGGRVLHPPPQSLNSTFELEFFGPSFKCYNLTTPDGNNETDMKAPANNPAEQKEVELLRPMHRLALTHYQVASDFNGEKVGWIYWGFSGVLQKIYQGAETRFNPAYTGYEELEEPTRMLDTLHIFLHRDSNHGQQIEIYSGISCMLWNTSYTVLFTSKGAEQSSSITRLERTEEVHVNGSLAPENFTSSQRAYKGYSDGFVELFTGSISSTESVFRDYSESHNSITEPVGNKGEKELLSTTLAYCPELNPLFNGTGRRENPTTCRNGTLLQAIEDLSLNVTLSLFSSPDLSASTTVTANFFTAVNRYSYNWQNLALAYGVGILVALVGISIGAYSYVTNGYSASMSFSSIVFTTRNPDLDKIFEGRCLPSLPLGLELGKLKLRYGMLRQDERVGHEHAAFGFSSTIGELEKGAKCV